jgi:hypothetical protein
MRTQAWKSSGGANERGHRGIWLYSIDRRGGGSSDSGRRLFSEEEVAPDLGYCLATVSGDARDGVEEYWTSFERRDDVADTGWIIGTAKRRGIRP